MKKHLLITTLVFALVLCFSFGALGADTTNPNADDPNQYKITEALQGFAATDNLFIGTLDKWKAAGGAVGDTGTFFQNGEAINGNDIIITNGKAGIVLAVGTRNPWGYPSGSVLDAGLVTPNAEEITKAVAKRDTVWSIEFLMNNWDSWAPDNCGTVTFDLVNYNFTTKAESIPAAEGTIPAVKVSRTFKETGNFAVDTYYGMAPNMEYAYMFDSVTYKDATTSEKMLNNFCITNKGDDGGSMVALENSKAIGTYGNKTDQEYSTFLVLPGKNTSNKEASHAYNGMGGSLGYKELHADYTFEPGESVTFDEYIVMSGEASTEALDTFLNTYNKAVTKQVSGTVTSGEADVANPVVVAQKDGKTYGWTIGDANGSYSFNLPAGEYSLFVERSGYAPGAAQKVEVPAVTPSGVEATPITANLKAGAQKVKITFDVKDQNGNALWGKVELFNADGETAYPTVRFTGDSVYYATSTTGKGKIVADVAPGEYTAVIYGEGYWFYSNPVEIKGTATKAETVEVTVNEQFALGEDWYAADLHHHANKNDAFSDPTDVIPSMLASGLDVAYITDHDFTVNNNKTFDLINKSYDGELYGFIPSEEISASWAHFNVIPQTYTSYDYFLDSDKANHVMNQFGKLSEFVNQTHENEATITANHPWSSYGLFKNASKAPGGFVDDYDNIEINADRGKSEIMDSVISAEYLWSAYLNNGQYLKTDVDKAHYLVGGSDTHDVRINGFANDDYTNSGTSDTRYATGKVRTVAYSDNSMWQYLSEYNTDIRDNGLSYANAVAVGNSYVTFGPILDMDKIPGGFIDYQEGYISDNEMDKLVTYGTYYASENFTVTLDVQSLAGIKDILVLTENSKDEYTDFGKSKRQKEYVKYDKAYSKLNVNAKEVGARIKVPVATGEKTWVAVMVVDNNGNFAVTNPWWVESVGSFSDVDEDAWYTPYVNALVEEGIITGYADNTFKPEANITRAEFAKMVAAWAPAAEKKTEITFSDVKEGDWYYSSVMYMAQNGYINGYPNKTFKPDNTITREEIAQILYKVCGLTATTKTDVFKDVPATRWSAEAINTLAAKGYVNGYSDGTFRPEALATRAEGAKFVYVAEHNGKVLLNKVQ